MRMPKRPPRVAMTIVFSLVIFAILAITMFLVSAAVVVLVNSGILQTADIREFPYSLVIFALTSVAVGTIVAIFVSGIPLRPVKQLIAGMNSLAAGDYSVRLSEERHPMGSDVSKTFNIMAEELQNTEMLRSDFVNNLSHEFKTPIVSIRGFAKLMQKEDLTLKQREYLEIIIEESTRLTNMTTNVLNLTKVENQNILTDTAKFNLSEQIRRSVLLLEKKWTQKKLHVVADFADYDVEANEEMLMQVWVNLLDNAIKYSPNNATIHIHIAQLPDITSVAIKNNGPKIEEEAVIRVFDKYWRDENYSAYEGTGIGLAIAKGIACLHEGDIAVISNDIETTFTVTLPSVLK